MWEYMKYKLTSTVWAMAGTCARAARSGVQVASDYEYMYGWDGSRHLWDRPTY